jgi:hypothetical protein
MKRRTFLPAWLVAFALLVFVPALLAVSGCDKHTDKVSSILNDPNSFNGKEVQVAGRVTRSLDPSGGLLNIGAYQVDDGSGKIWVVTHTGAPSVGTEIGVKAHVRNDFRGSDLIGTVVLNEDERKTR